MPHGHEFDTILAQEQDREAPYYADIRHPTLLDRRLKFGSDQIGEVQDFQGIGVDGLGSGDHQRMSFFFVAQGKGLARCFRTWNRVLHWIQQNLRFRSARKV